MATNGKITLDIQADIRDINKKLGQVVNQTKSFESKVMNVGKVIGGAFATGQLIEFGKEIFEIAKKAEGVRIAFNKIDKDGALLGNLRNAVKGTVSDLELMQRAVAADKLGIPVKNLATMFEFAHMRARELGVSSDYLVESIVNGIGRKSVLILDNLGISAVKVREEFAKTGDFAQAVGNIIQEDMGGASVMAMDTLADRADRLTAQFENMKLGLAEGLIPAASGTFDVFRKLGDLWDPYGGSIRKLIDLEKEREQAMWLSKNTTVDNIDTTKSLKNALDQFKIVTEEVLKQDKEYQKALKEQEKKLKALQQEQAKVNELIKDQSVLLAKNTIKWWEHYEAMNAGKEQNEILNDVLENQSNKALDNMWKKLEGVTVESGKASNAISKLGVDFDITGGKTMGFNTQVGGLAGTLLNLAGTVGVALGTLNASGGGTGTQNHINTAVSTIGGFFSNPIGTIVGMGASILSGIGKPVEDGGMKTYGISYEEINRLKNQARFDPAARQRLLDAGYPASAIPDAVEVTPYTGGATFNAGAFASSGASITVNGFVGSEAELANQINKVLNKNTTETNY